MTRLKLGGYLLAAAFLFFQGIQFLKDWELKSIQDWSLQEKEKLARELMEQARRFNKREIFYNRMLRFMDELEAFNGEEDSIRKHLTLLDGFFNSKGPKTFHQWYLRGDGSLLDFPSLYPQGNQTVMKKILQNLKTTRIQPPPLPGGGQLGYLLGKNFSGGLDPLEKGGLIQVNYKKEGFHFLFWSRVVNRTLAPNSSRDQKDLPEKNLHGVYLSLLNWGGFDYFKAASLGAENLTLLRGDSKIKFLVQDHPEIEGGGGEKKGVLSVCAPVFSSLKNWNLGNSETRVFNPGMESKLFLVLKKEISLSIGGITRQWGYYRTLFLVSFPLLTLWLGLVLFLPFLGISFKLFSTLFLIAVLPAGIFVFKKIVEIQESREGRVASLGSELLHSLDGLQKGLEGINLDIISAGRKLKTGVDYLHLTEKQIEGLRQELSAQDLIYSVMVFDSSMRKVFSYEAGKNRKSQGGDSFLGNLVQGYLPDLLNESNQDFGKTLTGDMTRNLVVGVVGNQGAKIFEKLDEFNFVNLGSAFFSIFSDLIFNQMGEFQYFFMMISREGRYIRSWLERKAELSHTPGEKIQFFVFDGKESTPSGLSEKLFPILNQNFKDDARGLVGLGPEQRFLHAYRHLDRVGRMVVARTDLGELNRQVTIEQWDLLQILVAFVTLFCASISFLAFRILKPIREIQKGVQAVESLDYSFHIELKTRDELTDLAQTLNQMIQTLKEKQELALKNAALSRFFSPAVVAEISKDPEKLSLGGKTSFLTAFFTDIAGFSSFSEVMSPQDLVSLLNEYLTAMTRILLENNGTLDKYEGDAIIAFFGAPLENPNHPKDAVLVALMMQKELFLLREKWISQGDRWPLPVHQMTMRIGINSGEILTGNMGSDMQMNYTMMGDSVNLAARLEGVCKQYGIGICVSDSTQKATGSEILFREIDKVRVVGKKMSTTLYEPLEFFEGADQKILSFAGDFERGISLVRAGKYLEGGEIFRTLLPHEKDSKKNPSLIWLNRCEKLIKNPEEWPEDGVFDLHEK